MINELCSQCNDEQCVFNNLFDGNAINRIRATAIVLSGGTCEEIARAIPCDEHIAEEIKKMILDGRNSPFCHFEELVL